jgi:hypothetical protein
MATGKERMARLRQNRLRSGERQVTVWLDRDSLARLMDLRRPGEHDSEVVRRALQGLEAQEASGHEAVTSNVTSDRPVRAHRPVTSDTPTPAPPSRFVTSDVTSDTEPPTPPTAMNGLPEIPAKDAPLVALLRQEPLLLYAEIAARLGISESQVKQKAAPWAEAGLVPKRPRGGARPRKATS